MLGEGEDVQGVGKQPYTQRHSWKRAKLYLQVPCSLHTCVEYILHPLLRSQSWLGKKSRGFSSTLLLPFCHPEVAGDKLLSRGLRVPKDTVMPPFRYISAWVRDRSSTPISQYFQSYFKSSFSNFPFKC